MASESRKKKIYELWMDIQDVIGPAKNWKPKAIRTLFWSKNIKNYQRFRLAAFVYLNPLPHYMFFEWVDLMGLCRDTAARAHLKYLLKSFDEGKYSYAWGWSTIACRFLCVKGENKNFPRSQTPE